MDVNAWFSNFEVIAIDKLKLSTASAFVRFAERHAASNLKVVETRRYESLAELVIIDFRTGCPQRPVYPIKPMERLAVRFMSDDVMPIVYVLRSDFPDTPHQYLPVEGDPPAICIDDRDWQEARLTWTPPEFVRRILTWFERASKGELDDARQPLDPVMAQSPYMFIILRDDLEQADNIDLVFVKDNNNSILRGKRPDKLEEFERPLFCFFIYRVEPETMKRLRYAPDNLGSLHDMLLERGINLFQDINARFLSWLNQPAVLERYVKTSFAVIVEMPIIAPDEKIKDGADLRAFIAPNNSWGDIAVNIGIAHRAPSESKSKVGYVWNFINPTPDIDAVRKIKLDSAEVHYAYDRILAADLSGQATPDERKVVIVGAGAIGSHVADCLSREGRFQWTVIDDDLLLPHNLARHIGQNYHITAGKAVLVAGAVASKFEGADPAAKYIVAKAIADNEEKTEQQISKALNEADIIIDATASVAAGRYLSDHPSKARRVSVFFNPKGTAGILLTEPENRHLTLRDLEAQLFSLMGREDELANLLAPPEEVVAYTGGCRAITNRMPESNVMTLSGLIAHGIGVAVNQPGPVMNTWSLSPSGAVKFIESTCEAMKCFHAGDWRICADSRLIQRVLKMRNEKLPNETGGVMTGVFDIPAKCIHLTDAAPAPADSKESPNGFTRGSAGVLEYLEEVSERTNGQVCYVGEWHSHPSCVPTYPSAIDLEQIDWLSTLFDSYSSPTLMLIAGDKDVRIILAGHEGTPKERSEGYCLPHESVGQ